jgi:hypothetical protein
LVPPRISKEGYRGITKADPYIQNREDLGK